MGLRHADYLAAKRREDKDDRDDVQGQYGSIVQQVAMPRPDCDETCAHERRRQGLGSLSYQHDAAENHAAAVAVAGCRCPLLGMTREAQI